MDSKVSIILKEEYTIEGVDGEPGQLYGTNEKYPFGVLLH